MNYRIIKKLLNNYQIALGKSVRFPAGPGPAVLRLANRRSPRAYFSQSLFSCPGFTHDHAIFKVNGAGPFISCRPSPERPDKKGHHTETEREYKVLISWQDSVEEVAKYVIRSFPPQISVFFFCRSSAPPTFRFVLRVGDLRLG